MKNLIVAAAFIIGGMITVTAQTTRTDTSTSGTTNTNGTNGTMNNGTNGTMNNGTNGTLNTGTNGTLNNGTSGTLNNGTNGTMNNDGMNSTSGTKDWDKSKSDTSTWKNKDGMKTDRKMKKKNR